MKKWDAHTHTELCRHGSIENTSHLVEKAIQLGFSDYSITEHAPLPDGFLEDKELQLECALTLDELKEYFQLVSDLKRVYRKKINILSGLEVDFIPGQEMFTRELIRENRENLDEWVLSLHFMKGKNGFRCVDYSPEDFQDGLIDYYGSFDKVYQNYWLVIEAMVMTDFEEFPPARLGHLALIQKFAKVYSVEDKTLESESFFRGLFETIKKRNFHLEFNVAGLTKDTCQAPYLTDQMLYWCRKLAIPVVYGSDSHSLGKIGLHYENYQSLKL